MCEALRPVVPLARKVFVTKSFALIDHPSEERLSRVALKTKLGATKMPELSAARKGERRIPGDLKQSS